MAIQLIVDNRKDVSQAIRTRTSRRKSKVLFHFLTRPFKDSNGRWVNIDRRSGNDRRTY
jgi:hypothetical protein